MCDTHHFYGSIDIDDMGYCPICSGPIFKFEQAVIVVEKDLKCLAHKDCVENLMEDDEEEEDDKE